MSTPAKNTLDLLQECRRRVILSVITGFAWFVLFAIFAHPLYHIISLPLIRQFPAQSHLIATSLTTPVMTPLKLALALAVAANVPVLAYHAWRFVQPALYPHEKHHVWRYCLTSMLLFYLGIAFAYWAALPLLFKCLLQFAPADVTVLPDMAQYLDLLLDLALAFGFAFQIPVITYACVHTGVVSYERLAQSRPRVVVLAFVLGMLLTPPDIVSQIMLALPLWGLFELGLWLSGKIPTRARTSAHQARPQHGDKPRKKS